MRKYAAYIHKYSHLEETKSGISCCSGIVDTKSVSNSDESLPRDHSHDHHHGKERYCDDHHQLLKAETCPSCLLRAESGGKRFLNLQSTSVMKCYCASMKAITGGFRHVAPETGMPSSACAIGRECRNPRHLIALSDCVTGECRSAAVSVDEKDGDEEFIVDIGQDASPPRFLSLTITRMTCTGCADKAIHVLRAMNGVLSESVRVSFLDNRAEMKFLPDVRGEDEIAETLRKRTGFRVVVMSSGSLEEAGLDKVRIGISSDQNGDMISKLEAVRSVKFLKSEKGQDILEVLYDPVVCGVRDLLSAINSGNDRLDAGLVDTPDDETVTSHAERKHLRHLGIITFVAGIITMPVVVLAWVPLPKVDNAVKYFIQMPLTTVVMGMAYQIYLSAFRTMRYGGAGGSRVDMDVLVLVATMAAWGFSVTIFTIDFVNEVLGKTDREPFFETCCFLVTLILAGRWIAGEVRMWALQRVVVLGGRSKKEVSTSISLVEGDSTREIDQRLLQYGDIIVAEKGDIITTDGVVVGGEAEVDESLLTGEAKPAIIQIGKLVMAGSSIVNGKLRYRVTRLMHENTVSVIKRMVRFAGGEKPKMQQMADKFAAFVTPAVLAIAVVVFVVWLLVGGMIRQKSWADSAVGAISYAVATLAVSCPCAIGLAVPMVMVFASRVAMRKGGFLFVNVIAVEKGWKASRVVFDKTGTLTSGKLKVVFRKTLVGGDWGNDTDEQTQRLVKTLCEGEKHPVSRALAASVGSAEEYADVVTDTIVGKGLEVIIDGRIVRGGRPSWCARGGQKHHIVKEVIERGLTVFTLSIDKELKAIFGLEDNIRPEAAGVIAELHNRGIETYIFSGDHKQAVEKVSRILGIPEQNCRSNCSPERKSSEIKALQKRLLSQDQDGKQTFDHPIVLFLGDGTNDAVALAQADVGLSMSDSTSVAISAADVAILSTSLTSVVSFLDLSKRVKTCIWVSFAWAVLWNFFAVLAAGGGFVVVRISPEWAGLGELGSVLPVVVIAAFVGFRWRRQTCQWNLERMVPYIC